MKLCSNKSNATSYEKADRSINKRCNSENVEEVKEKNCARDRILSLPFLKIMIFTLLLWIIQCSTDFLCRSGANVEQDSKGTTYFRVNRLLGQPLLEFDSIFKIYEENFLNKMGCNEDEKQKIKSTVKSYFDKINWENAHPPMQQNIPMLPQKRIARDSSISKIKKFLENFDTFVSPTFIAYGSALSLYKGEKKISLILLIILLMKVTNFVWDIRHVADHFKILDFRLPLE
ncbi:Plasmodium exported protein, unknown function [Plasmodium ovale]|uniref:Pv-fam-h protein n=2 Tax=Plasmodium ovale TaxID=36330 RepID=A0A1A8VT90_PLAOA|nr:Pv-fam-h protein [Plasmodium ovale curtisi]SBS99252.1 Pv-fam-h protein [Plasmodium ovale curtisi]SBT83982.1 Plasmodium exported protein, unknown function [Plasmodium ovale]